PSGRGLSHERRRGAGLLLTLPAPGLLRALERPGAVVGLPLPWLTLRRRDRGRLERSGQHAARADGLASSRRRRRRHLRPRRARGAPWVLGWPRRGRHHPAPGGAPCPRTKIRSRIGTAPRASVGRPAKRRWTRASASTARWRSRPRRLSPASASSTSAAARATPPSSWPAA